jgi:hypothetical protein
MFGQSQTAFPAFIFGVYIMVTVVYGTKKVWFPNARRDGPP